LPARYTISLWVTDQRGEHVYDNVENAVTFEVDTANLYKSNMAIDGRSGIVFFPQKWDLSGTVRPATGSTTSPPIQYESQPK